MGKRKHNPKKGGIDEWEVADIDRNEQKLGMERRARRWKEIETQRKAEKKAEKKAIENAEKMGQSRQPNWLEEAWLRCDYVLNNIMEQKAYAFMEHQRTTDPAMYKTLYKVFMSPNMMEHIQQWVSFFASGQKAIGRIPLSEVYKHYKKLKGIKGTIKVVHKGEEEREL